MKRERLLDVDPRQQWTGSCAIVLVDHCPECGAGNLTETTVVEPPLLRHGGYGAARETVRRRCERCGWALTVSTSEINPN